MAKTPKNPAEDTSDEAGNNAPLADAEAQASAVTGVAGVVLKCIQPFEAWGTVYRIGDLVDPSSWPQAARQEALTNRLTGGFVAFGA